MELGNLIAQYGKVKELYTPSGFKVIIREQNGDDDGILSNVSLTKDSTSVNTFIQSVVVWAENGDKPDSTYTDLAVLGLRLGDKYFILLSSRIFSLGDLVKFEYTWGEELAPVAYEEDLAKFIVDYIKPFPKPGEVNYYRDRIQPYKFPISETDVHYTLSTGKKIAFKYMDGFSEKYLMKLPEFQLSVNSRLIARELKLEVSGIYILVESFKVFTSKEMAEIREIIENLDPQFDGIVEVENPYERNQKVRLQLLGLNDFFFPRGI